ncbi:Hypothetical protein NTJ_03493 [Nesidiocoris tenuis]|uniref:Uncharacterized protein n=1 Tax=Nesidiocoris tenuis TaxID=355587 RepID=A0ABN7AEI2_9HEMI|nr:Hypothetical protein NTJ_03493 [Nesidiocoris tenuis]
MLFSCKCLNFIIETKDSIQPCEDKVKSLLSPFARAQELVVVMCESAKKKINDLVVTKVSNGWTEFSCAKCGTWVFSSQSKEADLIRTTIIVNKQCMTTKDQIDVLQSDPYYSPAFKIIVEQIPQSRQFIGDRAILHPVASSWLKDQTMEAEARINDYAKNQFAQLEELKKRVANEQLAINEAKRRSKLSEEQLAKAVSSLELEKSSSASARKRNSPVFDEDVFFMDMGGTEEASNSEESDDEPKDLPPLRNPVDQSYGHARSLPIPLPHVLEERVLNERLDRSPRTPQEIAENIRALAESVRGTTVFGELPPPRFPNKKNR